MQSTEMILTILVTVVAVVGLIQLIILFVMFLALKKAGKVAGEHAAEIKAKINPLLEQSRELIETTKNLIARIEPKIEAAASDLAEITRTATGEAKRLSASVDEVRERVRLQAERVDGMTTGALNGVDRFGQFVNHAAGIPVRQVSGFMAAAKAVVETLRKPAPHARATEPRDIAADVLTPREERIREERPAAVR